MRSKILTGAAELALITAAVLMAAGPTSAQSWQGNRGSVTADAAADVIGSPLATAPVRPMGYYDYYRGYYQGYGYAPRRSSYASYDYGLGYDYAPPYGYYGAYDWSPWSYRGGPHPR